MRSIVSLGSAAIVAGAATVRKHGSDIFHVRSVKVAALFIAVLALSVFMPAAALAAPALMAIGDTDRADIANLASTEVIQTFKEVYLDAVSAIPDATPLTAQLNKTTKLDGAADSLTFSVKLRTGGAVANVGDAVKLPRPSRG